MKIVEEEKKKLQDDVSRIFIGGYAEGCAIAIAAYLQYKGTEPLGGIIGISSMHDIDRTKLKIS